jgi:hypothetical protein
MNPNINEEQNISGSYVAREEDPSVVKKPKAKKRKRDRLTGDRYLWVTYVVNCSADKAQNEIRFYGIPFSAYQEAETYPDLVSCTVCFSEGSVFFHTPKGKCNYKTIERLITILDEDKYIMKGPLNIFAKLMSDNDKSCYIVTDDEP